MECIGDLTPQLGLCRPAAVDNLENYGATDVCFAMPDLSGFLTASQQGFARLFGNLETRGKSVAEPASSPKADCKAPQMAESVPSETDNESFFQFWLAVCKDPAAAVKIPHRPGNWFTHMMEYREVGFQTSPAPDGSGFLVSLDSATQSSFAAALSEIRAALTANPTAPYFCSALSNGLINLVLPALAREGVFASVTDRDAQGNALQPDFDRQQCKVAQEFYLIPTVPGPDVATWVEQKRDQLRSLVHNDEINFSVHLPERSFGDVLVLQEELKRDGFATVVEYEPNYDKLNGCLNHFVVRVSPATGLKQAYQDWEDTLTRQDGKVLRPFIPDIIRKHGYVALQHATELGKVISILQMGGLVTGEKVPVKHSRGKSGDNIPRQVFFDFTKLTAPPPREDSHFYCMNWSRDDISQCDFAQAVLIFDLDALATGQFHIGTGWSYGDYDQFKHYHWRQREDILRKYLEGKKHGEIVFYEDVPIRFLKEIWVHERRAAELMKSLQKAGITTIQGRPLADVIRISPKK